MRSVLNRKPWGLATAAAVVALAGAGFIVQSQSIGPFAPATASATKGDRLPRVVQVACDDTTLSDSLPGCADLARSVAPAAVPTFETVAVTQGQSTILIRRPVAE